MPLQSNKELLNLAKKGSYAVGAFSWMFFDISTLEFGIFLMVSPFGINF
jgi:hypothetical protein